MTHIKKDLDSLTDVLYGLKNPYTELNLKLSLKERFNLNNLRMKGTTNKKENIDKLRRKR